MLSMMAVGWLFEWNRVVVVVVGCGEVCLVLSCNYKRVNEWKGQNFEFHKDRFS